MSQYLNLAVSFTAYFVQHPEKAAALWALVVQAYESSNKLVEGIADAFNAPQPREAGIALTDEEQNAEERFNQLAGVPRGPFGNGKILRWLLTSEIGKKLLPLLLNQIPGMGS